MGAVLSAWLVEMGLQVYIQGPNQRVPIKSSSSTGILPVPSMWLADFLVFGLLSFGAKESSQARPICGILAWGLVAATLMRWPVAPGVLAEKLAGGQKGTSTPAPNLKTS
jgi:hypothetical protein